jgi:Gpi18-like mannosyltransferase
MDAVRRRARAFGDEHRDFILLAVLFVTFRMLAVLFLRPGGYVRDYADFTLYLGVAKLSDEGLYPSIHFWLEYPPFFPWLTVGLYRLSLLIPPWIEDPRLWFYALLSITLAVFEVGNFALIYAIGLLTDDRTKALRAALFYAVLFVPVYVLTSDFDSIPLFFMLLGLYLLLKERGWASGIALGVGFALKITPVILVPVAIRALAGLWRKAGHALGAAVTVIIMSLPFLFLDAHLYLVPLRAALGRSSWETIWAVAEGYFSYGEVGGNRFDRAVTDFSIHPQTLPWLWISLAFVLIYLWLYTRPVDYRDRRKVLALSTVTVALFMLYSKGYSPQFLVYLLPFLVLCCPGPRGVAYAVALSVLNFMEQPVYFVIFPDQHAFFVGIVSWRALILLAVVVEGAWILWPQSERVGQWWSRAVTVGMVIMTLWTIWAGVGLSRAYYDNRYQAESYRPAIDFLKEQAHAGQGKGVLFTDSAVYQRLYPFLHQDLALRVVTTGRAAWSDGLQDWMGSQGSFWLWRGQNTDPDLETWLDQHSRPVTSRKFDWGSLFLLSVVGESHGQPNPKQ